jgi:hypothetical protein
VRHRHEPDSLKLLRTLEAALTALPDPRLLAHGLITPRNSVLKTQSTMRDYDFCALGAIVAHQIQTAAPIAFAYLNHHEHFVPQTIGQMTEMLDEMDTRETVDVLMPWNLRVPIAYAIWNVNDTIGCGAPIYENEETCNVHTGYDGRPSHCPTAACTDPAHQSALQLPLADDENEETAPIACALRHTDECPTEFFAGFTASPTPEERYALMLAWTREQIQLGTAQKT